jgi:two-component system response regulator QseB
MRILLAEDDAMLGEALAAGLRQEGYVVDWVRDGIAAETALRCGSYRAVLLDLGLPLKSGLDVLRHIRAQADFTPALIATARDGISERIEGLDAGADDYVVKPFDLHEVSARIRAVTRRHTGRPSVVVRHGDLLLDPAARTVTLGGVAVDLSSKEFNVLRALLDARGTVVTRGQLEDALYGWGEEVESNAVEVHVHHLRRKLGSNLIRTVRGSGYCIRDADI